MKKQLLYLVAILSCLHIQGQILTVDQTTFTVEELVTDVLINSSCANVSNITFSTGTNFGSVNGIGFFQIGGGIAGDFPICVVPMLYQDMELENTPFWSYFCQISDSTTSYGSYSGAVPNEKITWGKLAIDTPKFIIESDATIVAPLIFAYLLNQ